MGTKAALHDVHGNYLFHVIIGGFDVAGFNKCSNIGWEIEEREYREGNRPTALRRLRRFTKVKDCTLEMGATFDLAFYIWGREAANYRFGGEFKRDVVIIQLDRNGNRVKSWTLKNCWVKEFDVGDFDANVGEARIERLVLAPEEFQIG